MVPVLTGWTHGYYRRQLSGEQLTACALTRIQAHCVSAKRVVQLLSRLSGHPRFADLLAAESLRAFCHLAGFFGQVAVFFFVICVSFEKNGNTD